MAPPNVTMMTRLTAESQRSAKMVRKHSKHKTYPFRARGESHTVRGGRSNSRRLQQKRIVDPAAAETKVLIFLAAAADDSRPRNGTTQCHDDDSLDC